MSYSEKVQLMPGMSLRESVAMEVLDAIDNSDTYRACNILRRHFPVLNLFSAKRAVDEIRKIWS